jgi:hypothetical protein
MKILKIIIFSFLLFFCNYGKTQTLSIDSVKACIGDTASLPIKMSMIDSAGAITLFIGYDTTMLDFINLTNINPIATGVIFNDMRAGAGNGPRLGKIAISWVANGPGIIFNAGTFAVLKFKVLSGNCPINFLNTCEIVNYNAQTLNINYINGSLIIPGMPVITTQPVQLSINTTQNGIYTVNTLNGDSIRWQINQGNGWIYLQNTSVFNGYNNDTLIVNHPGLSLNGSYIRCLISNLCYTKFSDSVILNVTELSVNKNTIFGCKIYPNPFSEIISLDFPHSSFIEEIKVYQIDGKLIKKIPINKQLNHITIHQLNELEKGIYFFEVNSINNKGSKTKNSYKLVKN